MSYIFKKGATSQSIELYIIDSTDGTPETGVLWNTAGIDLKYRRKDAAVVSITEAALTTPALTDTWETGGFLEIGNGVYRLDLPDAALASASGIDRVAVFGTVTGMVVLPVTIHLTDIDLNDAVRAGLTALPNAAADAAGGLPISDAGGLDLDTKLANTNEVTAARMAALTDWINGGRLDLILDIIAEDTTTDIPATIAAIKAETALIVADTNELQTDDYPTSIAAIKAETALIVADTNELQTDDIPTTLATLATPAQVNAQVLDVLNVDTFAEPGQEAPTATTSLVNKIGYIYKFLRNKVTNDGTNIKVYNDAGAVVDQKNTVSEAAGTVTRGEFGSGP